MLSLLDRRSLFFVHFLLLLFFLSNFHIIIYCIGAESFTEAMRIGCETYHTLKNVIKKKYGLDGKGRKYCIYSLYEKVLYVHWIQINKILKFGINECL